MIPLLQVRTHVHPVIYHIRIILRCDLVLRESPVVVTLRPRGFIFFFLHLIQTAFGKILLKHLLLLELQIVTAVQVLNLPGPLFLVLDRRPTHGRILLILLVIFEANLSTLRYTLRLLLLKDWLLLLR